jgi:hypothetical protein
VIYEHTDILIVGLGRSSEELEKASSVLGSVMIREMKLGAENMTHGLATPNSSTIPVLY